MSKKAHPRLPHSDDGPAHASASEVKNSWHAFVERVSRAREEIIVTRYGTPVLKLSPVEKEEPGQLFGWLAGTVTMRGDIVASLEEEWEADA